jgi:hypothetical protein
MFANLLIVKLTARPPVSVALFSFVVISLKHLLAHNTLFRGNTVFTKIMELSMSFYGKEFLEASVGSVLRRLCAEKVAIEVDPQRSGKGLKEIERNVDQLIYWSKEFWKQIYSVRTECPECVYLFTRGFQLNSTNNYH